MLSAVIVAGENGKGLAHTLASLVPAVAEGVLRDAAIVDPESRAEIAAIAEAAGCRYFPGETASALSLAAAAARASWLLLLEAGVVLERDWFRDASAFVERAEAAAASDRLCAVFAFASRRPGLPARLEEAGRFLLARFLRRPHRRQGLILHRQTMREISAGGLAAGHVMSVPPACRLVVLRARAWAAEG